MHRYWNIYSREPNGDLRLVDGTFQARTALEAENLWDEAFGDNYGKVVILPHTSTCKHQVFDN